MIFHPKYHKVYLTLLNIVILYTLHVLIDTEIKFLICNRSLLLSLYMHVHTIIQWVTPNFKFKNNFHLKEQFSFLQFYSENCISEFVFRFMDL